LRNGARRCNAIMHHAYTVQRTNEPRLHSAT
jgi:hypothetical protein